MLVSNVVDNYFVISFLIMIVFNILNFGTHNNNCRPNFFPYDFETYFCNFKIINGSLYCYEFHVHHWILGLTGLICIFFLKKSYIKSILNGILFAITLDGLLFSDRFVI